MRRYAIRIMIALLTFSVGMGLLLAWDVPVSRFAIDTSVERLSGGVFDISVPVVPYSFVYGGYDGCPLTERYIVLFIPNDDEIYLGRESLAQEEITERVRGLLNAQPLKEKVAFIKADDLVKYGTIVSITERMKEAGVTRIELVKDKKKGFKRFRPN